MIELKGLNDFEIAEDLVDRQSKLLASELKEIKEFALKLADGKYYCGYNNNDAADYRKIISDKYMSMLEMSLGFIGLQLEYSQNNKTVYAKLQEGVKGPKTKIDINTTKLIYMLRRYFLMEAKKIDTKDTVFYKWNDLLQDMDPFLKKSNIKKSLITSLWILKDIGIVNINATQTDCEKPDEDDKIVIEIYPAIACICNMEEIQQVQETLSSFAGNITINKTEVECDEYECEE